MEIISSERRRARLCRLPERRRRRRISITAGEESEANVTCGSNASLYNVLEEGEHKQAVQKLPMFALFLLWQATKSSARTILPSFFEPQASLLSAAQPAVMDIRRLRRRSLEIISIY